MKIIEYIQESFREKLPFVAYKKPNKNLLKGIFQQDDALCTVDQYSELGFVFAPFDSKRQSILIPTEKSKYFEEELGEINIVFEEKKMINNLSSKEKHIQLIESGVEAIRNSQLKKVVLSRKEKVSLEKFHLLETFQKLLHYYPNAFVYVWFHPKVGLWLGASPETLLKINGNKFATMSLAGTQLYVDANEVNWSDKELEEQQFVTDYITENLAKVCVEVQKGDLETVKAGKLTHLKTNIFGTFNVQNTSVKTLINVLHPTPAVCGLPKEASRNFILENEHYDRSFYTGFLGELNEGASEFYVNLRCMQIENDHANIYVGGGITKASNSISEWKETVSKSETMKRVL